MYRYLLCRHVVRNERTESPLTLTRDFLLGSPFDIDVEERERRAAKFAWLDENVSYYLTVEPTLSRRRAIPDEGYHAFMTMIVVQGEPDQAVLMRLRFDAIPLPADLDLALTDSDPLIDRRCHWI